MPVVYHNMNWGKALQIRLIVGLALIVLALLGNPLTPAAASDATNKIEVQSWVECGLVRFTLTQKVDPAEISAGSLLTAGGSCLEEGNDMISFIAWCGEVSLHYIVSGHTDRKADLSMGVDCDPGEQPYDFDNQRPIESGSGQCSDLKIRWEFWAPEEKDIRYNSACVAL